MKKATILSILLILFAFSFSATSCVKANPKCKKNAKKVSKMRKSGQIKM
ncbi:hypothetical protein [Sporocytophaga myxococcoides]|nr:hypothetical protein [Sporocytophaga myxococcoides]